MVEHQLRVHRRILVPYAHAAPPARRTAGFGRGQHVELVHRHARRRRRLRSVNRLVGVDADADRVGIRPENEALALHPEGVGMIHAGDDSRAVERTGVKPVVVLGMRGKRELALGIVGVDELDDVGKPFVPYPEAVRKPRPGIERLAFTVDAARVRHHVRPAVVEDIRRIVPRAVVCTEAGPARLGRLGRGNFRRKRNDLKPAEIYLAGVDLYPVEPLGLDAVRNGELG